MIITIDGPVASGKSTVARLLACRLGIYYLYTGLLYRALGYLLLKKYGYTQEQLTRPDNQHLQEIVDQNKLIYTYNSCHQEQIYFADIELTSFLKTPEIDTAASLVSTSDTVRAALLEYQRNFAKKYDLVVDGRDCGSYIFPYADYKFFLTADPKIRARRWQQDQKSRGVIIDLDRSLQEILSRDKRDSTRKDAPLCIPTGAIVIDTSELTPLEVVDSIYQRIHRYHC